MEGKKKARKTKKRKDSLHSLRKTALNLIKIQTLLTATKLIEVVYTKLPFFVSKNE